MYKEFLDFCKNKYSFCRDVFTTEAPSPHLFSFQKINLSKKHFEKLNQFIFSTYELRNNLNYQKKILGHACKHKNLSVLMSFDFHIHNDNIRLIEINTNASHFLTSYLMSDFVLKGKLPIQNSLEKLKKSFLQEFKFWGGDNLKKICIVDEKPTEQKAYFEFLMYQKLFEEMGFTCDIQDSRLFEGIGIDLIYNRDTDFDFSLSPVLKRIWNEDSACITPHPEEYQLLADKSRLLQFSNTEFLKNFLPKEKVDLFDQIVPKIFEANSMTKAELWDERKKYFFKPKNAFGGKGVFRGQGLTHKVFDEIYNSKNYLAQELVETGEIIIQDQVSHEAKAKWDLRVYVYAGEIQHLIARAYIGQTTNFRTLGGGFAAIEIDPQ